MKICEGKIQKEVIFIMRNSNKTREKITGVLIGLLLSALCVTPAFAAGTDVTNRLINLAVNSILIALAVGLIKQIIDFFVFLNKH